MTTITLQPVCPFCGAPTKLRSRFCTACGRPLPAAQPPAMPPVEAALPNRQLAIKGDTLQLRDLVNVVESGVRWWEKSLNSADALTRQHAVEAIGELSRILQSLSQQLALGRETVRVTTRLPVQRVYTVGCPVCGRGNRAGAKFCQGCGAALGSVPQGRTEAAMPLRLKVATRTDQGRVRKNNEDNVYAGELQLADGTSAYLCLVADGMGGARAGEQASQIAADVSSAQLQHGVDRQPPPDDEAWHALLQHAIKQANTQVYQEAHANAEQRGMGTTLTIAIVVGDRAHVASVGDSRAYLINAAGLRPDGAKAVQLTSDHSLVARLVDIGQITEEEARTHPQRNMLYRSVGTDPSVEVDTCSEQLRPGDIILLCSDGLISYVRDEELARIVIAHADPDEACEQLIALANERGGGDNISVIVARTEGG